MFKMKYREMLAQYPGLPEELDAFYARLSAFLSVSFEDDGTLSATAIGSEAAIPIGAIFPYGGTAAPSGWLLCDGTAISRSTYRTLFEVIGTAYGTGNGSTTFNLPDLRQRFPLGKAASGTGSTLGSTGGTIDHVHTGPSHTHTITSTTTAVQSGAGTTVVNSVTSPSGASGTGNTGSANAPYSVVNYIILFE